MKIGILSDTHGIDDNVIKHIINELLIKHKVEMIFHCGDIERQHLIPKLFGDLPVWCAINQEQLDKEDTIVFKNPPQGWR